jgi:hypothetical protein
MIRTNRSQPATYPGAWAIDARFASMISPAIRSGMNPSPMRKNVRERDRFD